jgi:2-polyprenyl-6-methoxyphenol hydroxylase-like FAD-dependent oxidoreductase
VGIAGLLVASGLSASGKKIVMLDQGPRYSEEDRAEMILRQKRTLNDYTDYNDKEKAAVGSAMTTGRNEAVFIRSLHYIMGRWRSDENCVCCSGINDA